MSEDSKPASEFAWMAEDGDADRDDLRERIGTLLAELTRRDTTPPPGTRLMLDLSTNNLPEAVCDALDQPPVVAHRTSYGWLMWVPSDPDDSARAMADPVPAEVLAVQNYARTHGCDYVLFDRDADVNPALPAWEW